ncbi:MAG: hypothetical protein WKG07_23390 [Hymenobacter sp.]
MAETGLVLQGELPARAELHHVRREAGGPGIRARTTNRRAERVA